MAQRVEPRFVYLIRRVIRHSSRFDHLLRNHFREDKKYLVVRLHVVSLIIRKIILVLLRIFIIIIIIKRSLIDYYFFFFLIDDLTFIRAIL